MATDCIDFCMLPSELDERVIELDFDYGKDRSVLKLSRTIYEEQDAAIEEHFSHWLQESNKPLLSDVSQFVYKSLQADETTLFDNFNSRIIHPATIILGMQASDYMPTIELISAHIGSQYKSLRVIHIGPTLCKKTHLLALFEEVPEQCRQLMFIIEQAEVFDGFLLETLVHSLYNRLQSKKIDRALILFCMSGGWRSVFQIIPLDSMNRMRNMTTIVKQRNDIVKELRDRLMDVDQLECFKLGPELIETVYDNFLEKDPSIMGLRYIYKYALFCHTFSVPPVATLSKPTLTNAIKANRSIVTRLRILDSIVNAPEDVKINWTCASDVAAFCTKQVKHLIEYHNLFKTQLHYYYILLRDETQEKFPSRENDVYIELIMNDDLGHSSEFYNAVSNIRTYPIASLMRRIDQCISDTRPIPPRFTKKHDIINELVRFKSKAVNNDDYADLVKDLISACLLHAQTIVNPFKIPLHELVYFNDAKIMMRRNLPSTRFSALRHFPKAEQYFNIIYTMIENSNEEMSMSDLFSDFMQSVEESTQKADHETSIISRADNSPTKKQRVEVRKSRRSTIRFSMPAKEAEVVKKKPDLDEGLLKAIFLDVIDTIQQHGLVKLDNRRSKKGILRKTIWLKA